MLLKRGKFKSFIDVSNLSIHSVIFMVIVAKNGPWRDICNSMAVGTVSIQFSASETAGVIPNSGFNTL